MYVDDQPKPDWEMTRKTQRRFSFGVFVVVVVVVLLNLLGTPGPSMWDHQQPFPRDVVASR
jgi:hypothetical protein